MSKSSWRAAWKYLFTFLAHHNIFPNHHHHATAQQWWRRREIHVTDDSAVTLGAEVEVRAEHVSAVNATKTKESSVESRRGHRRRIKY
jgi:hypothetical protein